MNDLKNKSNKELKENVEAMESKVQRLKRQARQEDRELNFSEASIVSDLTALIEDYTNEFNNRPADGGARTFMLGSHRGRGPFGSMGEYFMAVKNAGVTGGRVDPRLYQIQNAATGLNEGIGSEGSFLVQTDFSTEILQNAFDEGQLARRCRRQPIGANANGIKIPGVDETSRATGSRYGGVQSYWLSEASEKQKSKPKFRLIELNLKKNVVLIYATDELLQDASALEGFIREVAPKEIAFQVDDAIIRGTGAGMPLGILPGGSLVTVAKEVGQKPGTIVAEGVLKMVERTLGKSSNYVWLYHKSCLSQIYQLSLAVGTGGIPLFIAAGSMPNAPENKLLGIPLVELEQCSAVGTIGDLILADFGNGYILADKGGVQADMSIHVRFEFDESVFRFLYRVDGCPVLASAVTPYKGGAGATQSHFIALETR